VSVNDSKIKSYCLFPQSFSSVKIIFCLATSCVDLSSLRNIRYPAEWTGVNVPVVFKMKIKISKSRLSLLISGIICLNLLKNKIFKIKIWRDHDHERYKQMKSSQNIQRLGYTKFTSCSSDFVLKTLERASDLKMLIYFLFFSLVYSAWRLSVWT
jgi:hypothetical protein